MIALGDTAMVRFGVLTLAAAALTAVALAGPVAAATLELRDVPGKVVVLPEDRSDIAVTILRTDSRYPLQVSSFGDHTIVAGHASGGWGGWWFGSHISICGAANPALDRWLGAIEPFGGQPEVLVRTPLDVIVDATGGSGGAIARARNVDLTLSGCGDWLIGNVAQGLTIEDAGSSDVRSGSVGRLELHLHGSGDVATRDVASGLDVQINGSGDLMSASASGPVQVRVYGSGDVDIRGGRTPHLDLGVFGSGNVNYLGVAGDLDAVVGGSGDVHVSKVTGRVNRSTPGSGDVDIGP
jgi:hypothetical protein